MLHIFLLSLISLAISFNNSLFSAENKSEKSVADLIAKDNGLEIIPYKNEENGIITPIKKYIYNNDNFMTELKKQAAIMNAALIYSAQEGDKEQVASGNKGPIKY